MRKVIYTFLSLVLVFAPAYSYANTSTWYPQSVVVTGSTALITAAKQGFRSSISHVPSPLSVGKSLVKGVGPLALLMAVSQTLGDGVDWVLDPANNAVKYKVPAVPLGASTVCRTGNYDPWITAGAICTNAGLTFLKINDANKVTCTSGGVVSVMASQCQAPAPVEKYIPIEDLAAKVISNAASGNGDSQQVIKAAATDDVFSGVLENKLADNAVVSDAPFDPTKPNDPASTPFDASSLIAAMQSLMSAINNMSSSVKAKMETMLTELGLMNEATNKVINDSVDRVIANDNVKVGEIVAAIEAIEGNTLDGQVINDAIDKAIAAGQTDTASIVAAIEAIEGNTLDGQVINDAVDRVIANDNANAQATQDVVSQSIDKAIEAGQADATKVTDAVDAQTDAITTTDPTTGEKSLSLPSFCTWASPVCTFIDWSKQQWLEFTLTFTALKDWLFEDAPADDKDNTIDTPVLPVTPVQVAINFVGSCPAPLTFEYKIYNQTFKPSVPFTPMCEVAIMINPVIKICASIAAIFIVAGIRQGNS